MTQPVLADVRSVLAAAALLREPANCTLETFPAHTINVQRAIFGVMEEGNQRKFPSRLPLLLVIQKIILNVIYHCSN